MTTVNDFNVLIINGTVEAPDQAIIKINKTTDKTAYMREYMKPYFKKYRQENLDQVKVLEKRKLVKKKMRTVGIEVSNEDCDAIPLEEWTHLQHYISSKKEVEAKPHLMKFLT